MDVDDLYDTAASCSHGNVIGVMRTSSEGVLTCLPQDTLQSTIPKLNTVTGLPVLADDSKVIGVISRKDIIKVRNGKVPGTLEDPVSKHMTAPAIVISKLASVQQAADLMMLNKIRRLPVVDEDGLAVGIVSRSDIFKPLYREAYDLFLEKEIRALQGTGKSASIRTKDNKPVTWKIKYLYDGDCPMCLSLMTVLKRQDNNRGLIQFVNIADPDYNPRNHMGVLYDDAMETIHGIYPDGSLIQGTKALKALFTAVGLGWAVSISDLPFFAMLVDLLYNFLSANRLSMGGMMDGIIAAKRMDLSKKGVETCGDVDEQCTAEW